jgi:opacity protein-like surface antigen
MPAYAQTNANATRGFYGGVSLRDAGADSAGVNFGSATSVWNRYTAPTIDDSGARSLLFGGYRWGNDVAVEAAFNSSDKYALRSPTIGAARGGVGLALGSPAAGLADVHSRTWNMDVYTSWAFYKAFALYGRLGVGQTETTPLFTGTSLTTGADPRRLRDGVNYGVGLRYDVTPSLGLRLEYARFGRFAGDVGSVLPESDKVTFGVQFRF